MPEIATIIGGAGTGKTTHLMSLMEWWLGKEFMGVSDIGFCSFTRAARLEASQRVCAKFNVSMEDLERHGWFKTIHGCCYKLMGVKSATILSDSKSDKTWLSEVVGEPVRGSTSSSEEGGEGEDMLEALSGRGGAETALALWDAARNRLAPLEEIWRRADYCDERTPSYEFCLDVVSKYEQRKRLDNRCDYTDILGRYAGWKFNPLGHTKGTPEGEIPNLRVWFLDEAQDNSALSDAVARRLTSNAEWVYVVGDPFQAIYGWAGSDPLHFQSWVSRERMRVLPKSYRCAPEILAAGERVLSECSDYWNRNIAPADHRGNVEKILYREPWPQEITPRAKDSWLLLCRTNFICSRLAKRLDANGIPYASVKGFGSKWSAPVKLKTYFGLQSLEERMPITAEQWQAAVSKLPAKSGERQLLVTGAKTKWKAYCGEPDLMTDLEHLPEWGATPELVQLIQGGKWASLIDGMQDFRDAGKTWGWQELEKPRVRIGTIHGSKGMEADNVLLLTTLTHQTHRACEDQQGRDEEARLWYVGATRAKRRLIVAEEPDVKFRWEMPV